MTEYRFAYAQAIETLKTFDAFIAKATAPGCRLSIDVSVLMETPDGIVIDGSDPLQLTLKRRLGGDDLYRATAETRARIIAVVRELHAEALAEGRREIDRIEREGPPA